MQLARNANGKMSRRAIRIEDTAWAKLSSIYPGSVSEVIRRLIAGHITQLEKTGRLEKTPDISLETNQEELFDDGAGEQRNPSD